MLCHYPMDDHCNVEFLGARIGTRRIVKHLIEKRERGYKDYGKVNCRFELKNNICVYLIWHNGHCEVEGMQML